MTFIGELTNRLWEIQRFARASASDTQPVDTMMMIAWITSLLACASSKLQYNYFVQNGDLFKKQKIHPKIPAF